MEILALLLVQFGYATSYPITTELLNRFDPTYWATMRSTLGFLVLLPFYLRAHRSLFRLPTGMSWRTLLWLSFLGVSGSHLTFILGLKDAIPTEASLVVTTIPVWVYAGSLLRRTERFSARRTIGLCLAIVGVLVLYGRPHGQLNFFILLNAFVYGSYLVYASDYMRKLGPLELLTPLFGVGAVTLLVFAAWASKSGFADARTLQVLGDSEAWGPLTLLILVGTVMPYVLNAYAGRRLPASIVAIAVLVQPLITAVVDRVFYARPFDPKLLPSAAFILVGVGVATWKGSRPTARKATLALLVFWLAAEARAQAGFGDFYGALVDRREWPMYPLAMGGESFSPPETITTKETKFLKLYVPAIPGVVKWEAQALPDTLQLPSAGDASRYYNTHLVYARDAQGQTLAVFRPIATTAGCTSGCSSVVFHLKLNPQGLTEALFEEQDRPLRKAWHAPWTNADRSLAFRAARELPRVLAMIESPDDLTDGAVFPPQTHTLLKPMLVDGAAYSSYRIYQAALGARQQLDRSLARTSDAERNLFVESVAVRREAVPALWKKLVGLLTQEGAEPPLKRVALHLLPPLFRWRLEFSEPKTLEADAREAFRRTEFREAGLANFCRLKILLVEHAKGAALLPSLAGDGWPACPAALDRALLSIAQPGAKGEWNFAESAATFYRQPRLLKAYAEAAARARQSDAARQAYAALRLRFPGQKILPANELAPREEDLIAATQEYRQEVLRAMAPERPAFPVHLAGKKRVLPAAGKQIYLFFAPWCPHCQRLLAAIGKQPPSAEILRKVQLVESFARGKVGEGKRLCRDHKVPKTLCDGLITLPEGSPSESVIQGLALYSIPRSILTDAQGRILDFRHEIEFADGRDPWRAIEWILRDSDAALEPPRSPAPSAPPDTTTISFPSMGTVWKVTVCDPSQSLALDPLRKRLEEEALRYDTTFSDWLETSELRRLERAGMTKWQTPSLLFLRGLQLAQEAYRMSGGAFDVTVGALVWKALSDPVGTDELEFQEKAFRFRRDPKRLTFGGIAKGAATGALASILRDAGLHEFRVDAGGGNLAFSGACRGLPWPERPKITEGLSPDGLLFVSNSNSHQAGRQHVFDPRAPDALLKRSSKVACGASRTSTEAEIVRQAGLADAFSKVFLINPEFEMLPPGCENQGR